MRKYKNKYNKEQLKDLIVRLDNCSFQLRGFRYLISDQFTPQIIWAYETEDSDRFFSHVVPRISHYLNKSDWDFNSSNKSVEI